MPPSAVAAPPPRPAMAPIWDQHMAKAERALQAARMVLAAHLHDSAAGIVDCAEFHIVAALLTSRQRRFRTPGAARAAFRSEFVRTGLIAPEHYSHLKRAFAYVAADDHSPWPAITPEQAAAALGWAEEFLALGRRLLPMNPGDAPDAVA